MIRLVLQHVFVKAIPLYICPCGAQAQGSTVRREIDNPSSNLVGDCGEINNQHMPIGWEGRGLSEHLCPHCSAKKTIYRIVNTDNFGGDYPDEKFVGEEYTDKDAADKEAETLNGPYPEHNSRYHKVVEMPYELQPGFEP
jgi:hypothetical protein